MDEILQKHILLRLQASRGKAISISELIEKIYSQDIIPPDPDAVKKNLISLHGNGFVLLDDINPKDTSAVMIKITDAGLGELNRLTT